jgi:hypothetical protein
VAGDITTQPKQGRQAGPMSSLCILLCLWPNLIQNNLDVPKTCSNSFQNYLILSIIYTGDKTLNVVAVASNGDLKRLEDFYLKSHHSVKTPDPHRLCKQTF